MGEQEIKYAIALHMIRNIGHITYKKLTQEFGNSQNALEELAKKKSLTRNLNIYERAMLLEKATLLLKQHQTKKVSVIPYEHTCYPGKLKQIHNPPSLLYSTSLFDFNKHRLLAIVGTREATNYGKNFVKKLVKNLAKYQVSIVSGLAYGIDICVHRAALANNLPTIGVVAGGLDMIYPPEHKKEVKAMLTQGCVISEQPLGIKPEKHHFPVRNRIIAGMVDAVVVIEAGKKSGALITAKYANDFNREVFALPGNVENAYSTGCNDLIKTHQAHIVTSAEDIAYLMHWDRDLQQEKKVHINLNQEESSILTILQTKSPLRLKELTEQTNINPKKLSCLMLQLEMKNLIAKISGNEYASV